MTWETLSLQHGETGDTWTTWEGRGDAECNWWMILMEQSWAAASPCDQDDSKNNNNRYLCWVFCIHYFIFILLTTLKGWCYESDFNNRPGTKILVFLRMKVELSTALHCLSRKTLLRRRAVSLRWNCSFFFKVYFIDYAITVFPIFFSPLLPSTLHPQTSSIPPLSSCPWVVHISSLTSVSYTILNLPPSILYLPIMILIPCTFPPLLPLPPPSW